jgi:hypothetical protein
VPSGDAISIDRYLLRTRGRRPYQAGGIVAAGVCFYQSYAREMAEANGWQRLLTNSAKLVNIIVASPWMLREMVARGLAPRAIVFGRTNTILAQGAAFAELRVEPDKGLVTILNRD